ncbi:hypothetical protein ACW7C5_17795, partial [Klebsiella pneumoniae]
KKWGDYPLKRGNLRFVTPLFVQTTRAEIVRRWQGLAGFRLVIRYKYLTTRFVVEENGISYFISNVSG